MAWLLISVCFKSSADKYREKTYAKSAYSDKITVGASTAFNQVIEVWREGCMGFELEQAIKAT